MEVRIIYCIPSLVLYLFVLVALFREVKVSTGYFYSLLITQTILNIIVFVNSFYLIQLANTTDSKSWFSVIYTKAPIFITSISNCLAMHFAYVQTYMTFFISLYRMTVITIPTKHIQIWSYAFPLSIAITLLTPFFSTYQLLIYKSWFEEDKISKGFFVTTDANMFIVMTEMLAFMSIFLIVSSGVNVISVAFLCIRAKSFKQDKAERNMFILALLDFFIETAFFVLFVIIYDQSGVSDVADKLIPYASDILTFSNAYLLMILNKRIRKRVLLLIRCSDHSNPPALSQNNHSSAIVVSLSPAPTRSK
ncbi:hypothetical protein Y032_0425g1228 [Ancylostoma ceylanicum]|uniref:Serpentine receptor class gamma n=1 Tax=Ancylostoma ceylanicum TaxID=53326 RepID=A0A016X0R2_9BILA|nr:hypothetical protein Y032_0425g1228 [Ancylostoma ceylanicum]